MFAVPDNPDGGPLCPSWAAAGCGSDSNIPWNMPWHDPDCFERSSLTGLTDQSVA